MCVHVQEVDLRAATRGSAPAATCRYRLAALLLHRGVHWVALVRHGVFWCLADDASVSPAGTSFASACQVAASGLWSPSVALYAAQPRDGAACAGAGGPWDPMGLCAGGARAGPEGCDGWQRQRRPCKGRCKA